MTQGKHCVPQGSTILVTGANGYLASAITKLLLELGYKVRGTVRAPKPWLNHYFEERYGSGNFETVIITDFQDTDTWDQALEGISGIAHVAHDMAWSSDPNIAVRGPVKAILNILDIASKHDSVKRIVLTSTIGAAPCIDINGNPATTPVNDDDWNDFAVEAAWSDSTPEEQRVYINHCAAKVEGDRKALQWVQDNQPGFDVNIVMPGFSVGRILHASITGQSMREIVGLLQGKPTKMFEFVPPWFINTEDVARLHVIALLKPEVSSQRIFACASPFTWKEVVSILRELDPSNTLIPDAPDENRRPCHVIPATEAERLIQDFFGRNGFTSLRDSLASAVTKSA